MKKIFILVLFLMIPFHVAQAFTDISEFQSWLDQRYQVDEADYIQGESIGQWKISKGEVQLSVLIDEENDRLRIMLPLGVIDIQRFDFLQALLESNFAHTVDARYALTGDLLWSVYLHPFSTTTGESFEEAMGQVLNLASLEGLSQNL